MPNKSDIVFQQRDENNTKFVERIISGSNLFIKTDANGVLTSSSELSASYALTASYLNQSDGLYGSFVRTMYSRNNLIQYDYNSGQNVDFFSGSLNTSFGIRTLDQTFISNSENFNAKIIHFRVVNYLTTDHDGGNSTEFSCSLYIGNDKLIHSDLSNVSLADSSGRPSEIVGELIFNQGTVRVCYSIGWCDRSGTYYRIPLSDSTVTQDVGSFTGGDLKLIVHNSTDRSINSYYGYIQPY